jgi:Transposase
MHRKRYTVEQIIGMLREADALLSAGKTAPEVCRHLGIGESTYTGGGRSTKGVRSTRRAA